jgi:hypothetical protein
VIASVRKHPLSEAIRDFIATYDGCDSSDRRIRMRILERLHAELYRREREHCPEWVDVGGES